MGVTTCPHGHPIGDAPREPGVPLVTVPVGSTVRVLRHENEAEELLHAYKRAGIEPGDSIEITGLTGESLELLTPAKGATSLSIPESRAVTVAIEESGDGADRRGGRAGRGGRAAHVVGTLKRPRVARASIPVLVEQEDVERDDHADHEVGGDVRQRGG